MKESWCEIRTGDERVRWIVGGGRERSESDAEWSDLKNLPFYMEIPDDIADDEDRISDYLSEQTFSFFVEAGPS